MSSSQHDTKNGSGENLTNGNRPGSRRWSLSSIRESLLLIIRTWFEGRIISTLPKEIENVSSKNYKRHSCVGPRWGSVRGPCEEGRHFGDRGTGSTKRGQWASVEPRQGRRKDVTGQNEEMAGSRGRLPLHGFRTRACTEWVHVHSLKKTVCKYHWWHCTYYIYCFRKINHLVLLPFAFILWCTRSRVRNNSDFLSCQFLYLTMLSSSPGWRGGNSAFFYTTCKTDPKNRKIFRFFPYIEWEVSTVLSLLKNVVSMT